MAEQQRPAGPQFGADRPTEHEAVRTTIVGGRPPGSGQPVGSIPRGLEVLVKKAAVDPAFKEALLERRAEAAESIGLKLEPAEAMMLSAAPAAQIEAIIARTRVPQEHRRAFLGQAAAAMLATLGVVLPAEAMPVAPGGAVADRPPQPAPPSPPDKPQPKPAPPKPEPPSVAQRVIAIFARRLQLDPKQITRTQSLMMYSGATPSTLASIRQDLEREFSLEITTGAFAKLGTVGQVTDYIEAAVEKKAGSQRRAGQEPQIRGIRPDRPPEPPPPPPAGIRPDRPASSPPPPGQAAPPQ
jgi:acyl carrier protein